MIFDDIRKILSDLGFPSGDLRDLPTSYQKFEDGADFRIEIPSINSVALMEAILDESNRLGIKINRLTETYGIFRHTETEIKEMVALATNAGSQFIMSIGPRASYDTSATAGSVQGKSIGYRLRGQEQVIRAIADIYRAINLGVYSFLVYDEGLLMALGKMKASGHIDKKVTFKVSAHCGHGNPLSFKLLESLGANSINPVRDLDLSMLATLRATVKVPLDCHTDAPITSGGFVRTYEAPEMVRVASPVYLKTGTSALKAHGTQATKEEAINMVRQASIILEMVNQYYPNAKQSPLNAIK